MIRLLPLGLSLCAASLAAQTMPTPSAETPRIQSLQWQSGETVILTALPGSALTVMLEPGEAIQRAVVNGNPVWEVTVSREGDSFQVSPRANAVPVGLTIETDRRLYQFTLETGEGLMAAYLVRLEYGAPEYIPEIAEPISRDIVGLNRTYRLRGDKSVRPLSILDNGEKTVIEYSEDQALPAVFAIGPSGDEEVVDGYMRDGKFVIDRVHDELVFRIDKEKATARRERVKGDAK